MILTSTIIVAVWPDGYEPLWKKIVVTFFNLVGLGCQQIDAQLKNKDTAVSFQNAARPLEDMLGA